MRIIPTSRPNSWLQWPVFLTSCKEPDLHVTAKYFGAARIDCSEVRKVLIHQRELCTLNVDLQREGTLWNPVKFSGLVYVLELTAYHSLLDDVHHSFTLIRDDFETWRPHITVPKKYWDLVKKKKLTPKSELIRFGELELYLGGADD